MLNFDKVMRRFKKAKADKQLWESHLRECYQYAIPERNTIDKWEIGAKKQSQLFDSTLVDALADYASRMSSLLVPNGTKWMLMKAGTEIPTEAVGDIEQKLEKANSILYEHINSSNFSSQVHEAFLDLGISTGALIIEAGDGIQSSLNFRAISLSELYLAKSSRGIIETVFREFSVPCADIPYTWKTAKISDELKQKIKENPEAEVRMIEGVIEEEGKIYSILISQEEKSFLIAEQLESNPWVVFREETISGETIGRGRVMRVLNDAKTLNRMADYELRGLALQALPIWTAASDGVINPYTIKVEPNTVIPVGSNENANPTLRALQAGGNPQLLEYRVKALQDSIRRTMLSKPFGNIEETPVRTATEMSIRNADHAQISVGASGRIQVELLERLIKQCVYVLTKAGKLPPIKVDGKEIALKFVNPSSRQQEESLLAAYARFGEFAQMMPEYVPAQIKVESIPASIWDALGLPATGKRTELEAQQYQENIQAQQQAQMEAQQNGQG